MLLVIILILLAMIGLAAFEIWLLWYLGARDDRRHGDDPRPRRERPDGAGTECRTLTRACSPAEEAAVRFRRSRRLRGGGAVPRPARTASRGSNGDAAQPHWLLMAGVQSVVTDMRINDDLFEIRWGSEHPVNGHISIAAATVGVEAPAAG